MSTTWSEGIDDVSRPERETPVDSLVSLRWSSEVPTVPGWYWVRTTSDDAEIVRLKLGSHESDPLLVYTADDEEVLALTDYLLCCEWYGPILPPAN